MPSENWKSLIKAELEQGKTARNSGNHGKARVCARRAAGIAIGEFLFSQGIKNPDSSAYERLKFMANYPGVDARVREICHHLILRVSEDFKLPVEIDLIAETYELIQTLFGATPFEE